MRSRRLFFVIAMAFAGLIALAGFIGQQALGRLSGFSAEGITFTDSYQLEGRALGDQLVMAEVIDLAGDAIIPGDAALLAATITLDGRITGAATLLADQVRLGPGAVVEGDLVILAADAIIDGEVRGALDVRVGSLRIEPGAQLGVVLAVCADTITDNRADAPPLPACATDQRAAAQGINLTLPVPGLLATLLASVAVGAVAVLGVVLFPQQIGYIAEAVRFSPRRVGGMGCLSLVLGAGVLFAGLMLITLLPPLGLVLVPLALIAGLALVGMALAGWVTMALLVGDFLLRGVARIALPPLVAAVAGNLALIGAWHLLALIPYGGMVGLAALSLLGMVGLGAALYTRAGTHPPGRRYFVQG